jgi:signal transduction histidine kinase
VLRDITVRKGTQEALRIAHDNLRDAKEAAEFANAAKHQFLSRASHELRTPMSHVLGYAQLLENEPLTGEQHDNIQKILSSGRHLLELINRILAVAQTSSDDLSFLEIQPHDAVRPALSGESPLPDKSA